MSKKITSFKCFSISRSMWFLAFLYFSTDANVRLKCIGMCSVLLWVTVSLNTSKGSVKNRV